MNYNEITIVLLYCIVLHAGHIWENKINNKMYFIFIAQDKQTKKEETEKHIKSIVNLIANSYKTQQENLN